MRFYKRGVMFIAFIAVIDFSLMRHLLRLRAGNFVTPMVYRLRFPGRKSDGEPRAKTIWHGLDKVPAAAGTFRALRERLG